MTGQWPIPQKIGNRKSSDRLREAKWPEALGEDAYHGLVGEVVRTIEPHSEADPAALLIQFLVAFGSVVGRGPYYQVEGDRHYGNLYAVLVGKSSKARKGTSWGRISQLFEQVDSNWLSDCVHSGLSSGEGLIWAVRDSSAEGDSGISDKRLLVQESEFANVLKVMTREGNTLSRVIRDGWDRGNLGTMTKNSPARATGAHISIVGHVTADELCRYLNATESANGFANRFQFICVRRARLLPHGGNLDQTILERLAVKVADAVDAARRLDRIVMDDDAKQAWTLIYSALSEGKPALVGSITARSEAQVIRLALVYAMIDGSSSIRVEHLHAAIAVWEYAEESANCVFGNNSGNAVGDEISRALRATDDGLTRTQISQLFGKHKASIEISAALKELAAAGLIVQVVEKGPGRTPERWKEYVTATS
jgi:Protein of unknown function (DUF3987)